MTTPCKMANYSDATSNELYSTLPIVNEYPTIAETTEQFLLLSTLSQGLTTDLLSATTSQRTPSTNTNMVLVQGTMKWIFICVGALGLLNNLVVMVVVLKVKKLRHQPRNWFIFHQSLADFISAMFVIAIAMRTAVTSFNVSFSDVM